LASACTASGQDAHPTTTPVVATAPAPAVPEGQTIKGDTPCPPADGSARTVILFEKPPPTCIDPAKTYLADVHTGSGDFTITLDQAEAPAMVNNFVVLARYHYFDNLPFDQSSPTPPGEYIGSGVHPPPAHSDPGYRIPAVSFDKAVYKEAGTVIIDNEQTGQDGGLWIVLLSDYGVAPRFTILGHVTAGLDIAKQIGSALGAPAVATKPSVQKVTIRES
jgi:peptidyl-prolyl cis-trans isomerase B (cyclophilin B)